MQRGSAESKSPVTKSGMGLFNSFSNVRENLYQILVPPSTVALIEAAKSKELCVID